MDVWMLGHAFSPTTKSWHRRRHKIRAKMSGADEEVEEKEEEKEDEKVKEFMYKVLTGVRYVEQLKNRMENK